MYIVDFIMCYQHLSNKIAVLLQGFSMQFMYLITNNICRLPNVINICVCVFKFNFNIFHKADILLAVGQIEEVIKMDDSCPFYHASKALYYGYMGLLNIIPNQEAFTISKKAAEIAISLDPTDPEANYAYGVVYYFFEKDLDKAQFYVDLALKYRPNYTEALLGGSSQ